MFKCNSKVMILYIALIALKSYTKPNNGGGGAESKRKLYLQCRAKIANLAIPASPQICRPTGQTADVSTQVTYHYHMSDKNFTGHSLSRLTVHKTQSHNV
jgi:hypothetical protein